MPLCYQRRSFTFKYEHTYSPRSLLLTFLVVKGLDGGPDPAFPLLCHNDPASRTTLIDPYTFLSRIPFVFFANTASCAKILANPAFRVAVKSVSRQEICFFPESRAIFLSNPMDLYIHILIKKWMCPDFSSQDLRQLDSRERPLTLLTLSGRVGKGWTVLRRKNGALLRL